MSSKRSNEAASSATSSPLRGVIALNAVLLVVLAAVTFGAQAGAQARARGDYLMVGGTVPGSDSAAVYILDQINQEMMAVNYNHNNKSLNGLGYRNLAADAANLTQNTRQRRQ